MRSGGWISPLAGLYTGGPERVGFLSRMSLGRNVLRPGLFGVRPTFRSGPSGDAGHETEEPVLRGFVARQLADQTSRAEHHDPGRQCQQLR
jgi:hypothetical protein